MNKSIIRVEQPDIILNDDQEMEQIYSNDNDEQGESSTQEEGISGTVL